MELTYKIVKLLSARAAWAILHTGKTKIVGQHVPQITEDSKLRQTLEKYYGRIRNIEQKSD